MATPISFTIRPPSAPARPSPLGNGQSSRTGSWRAGPPSRRHFEQGDDDDVDEDDDGPVERRGVGRRDEGITGFGNGRALGGEKEAEPMVIAPLPNRDWRQSSLATGSRRAPSYRPDTSHRDGPIDTHERVGDEPQLAGLRYVHQSSSVRTEGGVKVEVEVKQETVDASNHVTSTITTTSVKTEPLTLEEQALQAILNGHDEETEAEQMQKDLVIGMDANEDSVRPVDEADAFRRDVATRPDESTLDDYATIPVSAFGLAIVRGMGYNPSNEAPIHIPKARPHLLGIGATPLDVAPPKPGSKKKGDDYKKRTGRGYVPNVLVRKEREGSGSATPGQSSRRTSPDSDSSRRREDRRDDRRDSARRGRDGDKAERDRREDRYKETSQERAERKAKERYRERDRETDEERARRKAKERNGHERLDRSGSAREDRNGGRENNRSDDWDRRRDERR